ncbi:hypothetical protein DFR70_101931 [Nocardia tenerifensis]|uniref:Uncharacterized protein n=1 Tax=Nocardia tenerifensis TaxID=228006 RepID=A0A318KCE7_9NOCA|nr:hypothetical protein [Nocardia tenerifensis]PXX71497.1 hypothetical protein DFR70_101931 [Nocardia tenerifensis]
MSTTTVAAARIGVAAVSALGFAAVIGSGTAQAAPQDCVVTRDLVSATATCHDTDAPAGREYALIIECTGLHLDPYTLPFIVFGPYQGSWGGSFAPTGQGSATCLGPVQVGTATNAYVKIYRD